MELAGSNHTGNTALTIRTFHGLTALQYSVILTGLTKPTAHGHMRAMNSHRSARVGLGKAVISR